MFLGPLKEKFLLGSLHKEGQVLDYYKYYKYSLYNICRWTGESWVAVARQEWSIWGVIYLMLRLSPGRLDPISYQGWRKVIPEFIKFDFFWIYRCIVLNKSCSNGHLVMLKHIKMFITDENHHVTRNIQNWRPVTVWIKHLLKLASPPHQMTLKDSPFRGT